MKYTITSESIDYNDNSMFRIRALIDIEPNIKAGDLGGFVTGYHNLSQEGNCWIHPNAIVTDNAHVQDDAQILGDAMVGGHATIRDRAIITDQAIVFSNATVSGDAYVSDEAVVVGNAIITDDAIIAQYAAACDNATVGGEATLLGNACAIDNAVISGDVNLSGNDKVGGNARIINHDQVISISNVGPFYHALTAYIDHNNEIELNHNGFTGSLDGFLALHQDDDQATFYENLAQAIKIKLLG